MKYTPYIIGLFLLLAGPFWAQYPELQWTAIGTSDGLSNRIVSEIKEDNQGFIWVSTSDGLNRLEGYRIAHFYYHTNPTKGVINNEIGSLFTQDSLLWIGTTSGLCYYNTATRQFGQPKGKASKALQKEFLPHCTLQNNRLWVFGSEQFYRITGTSVQQYCYRIPQQYNITKGGSLKRLFGAIEDHRGTFWGNYGRYLLQLDPQTMHPVGGELIGTQPHEGITNFCRLDQTLWLSTWGAGIVGFNPATRTQFQIKTQAQIIHDITVYEDATGMKWIVAGSDKGLIWVNPKTLEVTELPFSTEIYHVYADSKKNLWLSTAAGVRKGIPENPLLRSQAIAAPLQQANIPFPNDEQLPLAIHTTPLYNLVSFRYGAGMMVYDRNWQPVRYIASLQPKSKDPAYRDIRAVYPYKNTLWVCTDGGFFACDSQLNPLKQYRPDFPNHQKVALDRAFKILPYTNDKIILLNSFGVSIFDVEQKKFCTPFATNDTQTYQLTDAYLTDGVRVGDRCYLTTENGVIELNLSNGRHRKLPIQSANQRFTCIEYAKGNLYLGSQSGLIVWHCASQKQQHYFREHGLSSDALINLKWLRPGVLAIATGNGLTLWEIATNRFKSITQKQGLHDNLLEGALGWDTQGKLVVGTMDHLNFVDPKILNAQTTPPSSYLLEVRINQSLFTHWDQMQKGCIELPHDQNTLNIRFALPEWNTPGQHTYYYALNGKWTALENGALQLNALAPGSYQLEFSSVPQSSASNAKLCVIITPPFYTTWWFAALVVAAIAALFYGVYRYRIAALKQQQALEQAARESEMKMLRAQMNPHFIFNTLNSIKSYIIQNHTHEAADYLTTFSKLMRAILDLSKVEKVSLSKEIQALQMYLSLEAVRLEHRFDYAVSIDPEIDQTYCQVPPLFLQPFVENAIWHGIHPKKDKGMITISCKLLSDTQIEICIEDDGIGRKKAQSLKKEHHQSHGIAITQERLTLANPLNTITYTDLYHPDGQAAGTRVTLLVTID